jgi:hypothetical protein
MLEKFGARRFEPEIVDAMNRLKRAAEARYRSSLVEQT